MKLLGWDEEYAIIINKERTMRLPNRFSNPCPNLTSPRAEICAALTLRPQLRVGYQDRVA